MALGLNLPLQRRRPATIATPAGPLATRDRVASPQTATIRPVHLASPAERSTGHSSCQSLASALGASPLLHGKET